MASLLATHTAISHHTVRDPVSAVTGGLAWVTGLGTILASSTVSFNYGMVSTAALVGSSVVATIVIGSYSRWRRTKLALDLEENELRRSDRLKESQNRQAIDKTEQRSLTRRLKDVQTKLDAAEIRRAEDSRTKARLLEMVERMERKINSNTAAIQGNTQTIQGIADSRYELPVHVDSVHLDIDFSEIDLDSTPPIINAPKPKLHPHEGELK